MSVSPSADAIPTHRLPRRLQEKYPERFPDASGPNTLQCWWMGEGEFVQDRVADRLCLRPDSDELRRHGLVEPDPRMELDEYESALQATRDNWQRWEE